MDGENADRVYQPIRASRSEYVELNGLRYHVRSWGEREAPKLFLLHGWMDVAASFQFLVDALPAAWCFIAPDWRGFGLTQWAGPAYYFPDYFADLDALLDRYEPHAPANLIGHSMGGNIAGLYAGARPARIRRLAILEGFGLKPTAPEKSPERIAKWLDQLKAPPAFRPYGGFDELAARLQSNNPRLSEAKAQFLARHWGRLTPNGQVELASDPRHKLINPVLYRLEEARACWRRIGAPVLWVRGADSNVIAHQTSGEQDYAERMACFAQLREVVIPECGHMMHHDQPEQLATLIEAFCA